MRTRGRCIAIFLVALPVCLFGCARPDTRLAVDARNAAPPDTLQVVHVVSGRSLLAGFPTAKYEFVTAARELSPLLTAVVDGYPMLAKDNAGSAYAAGAPWLTLTGRGLAMDANVIDPDYRVSAYEPVLVGGFAGPAEGMTPVQYLSVPASVVTGQMESRAGPSCVGPICFIEVPEGEYGGFIGGPAACRDADGMLRVWGVIVGWQRVADDAAAACRLEVARLVDPETLMALMALEGGGGSYRFQGPYDAPHIGPVGEAIIEYQSPAQMNLLRALISSTDVDGEIVTERNAQLPMRRCDYAVLIAESVLMKRGQWPGNHTFGPYSSYEYRDDARRHVMKVLYGTGNLADAPTYTYVTPDGIDITEERRALTVAYYP